MRKSYYTFTPDGNKTTVFERRREIKRNTILYSLAAGACACVIAARIVIPIMWEARGAFHVGGEFFFCAVVGFVVGKVTGKIYEQLKTRR